MTKLKPAATKVTPEQGEAYLRGLPQDVTKHDIIMLLLAMFDAYNLDENEAKDVADTATTLHAVKVNVKKFGGEDAEITFHGVQEVDDSEGIDLSSLPIDPAALKN